MCCQPGNRHGLPASEIDRRRRYSIRMQPRWNHAKSVARPNASSLPPGLEGKEIPSPSSRGRKMSLPSPLIDQPITHPISEFEAVGHASPLPCHASGEAREESHSYIHAWTVWHPSKKKMCVDPLRDASFAVAEVSPADPQAQNAGIFALSSDARFQRNIASVCPPFAIGERLF
jgi:hypothetical protein